jgi:hypothetical protein
VERKGEVQKSHNFPGDIDFGKGLPLKRSYSVARQNRIIFIFSKWGFRLFKNIILRYVFIFDLKLDEVASSCRLSRLGTHLKLKERQKKIDIGK